MTLMISVAVALQAKRQIRSDDYSLPTSNEPLYLPEARYVRLITLNFNNFFADLLWFNTINYFGKEMKAGHDFRWLGHMCDLVTSLDPKAVPVYELCSTLLSWMVEKPELSAQILSKGIESNPQSWRLRYLQGFTSFYFLEDKQKAAKEMKEASLLPDSPPFVANLASRLLASTNDAYTAAMILQDVRNRTDDPAVKAALEDKLRRAKLTGDLALLNSSVRRFYSMNQKLPNSLNELVLANILKEIPSEPFGGQYILQGEEVRTSSGEPGLTFSGKTAKTGLMKQQFKD